LGLLAETVGVFRPQTCDIMAETKNCPYCGEEILAVAKKCKHCGEWLTGENPGTVSSSSSEPAVSKNEPQQETEKRPVETPKGAQKKSLLWPIIGGCAAILVVLLLLLMPTSPNNKTAIVGKWECKGYDYMALETGTKASDITVHNNFQSEYDRAFKFSVFSKYSFNFKSGNNVELEGELTYEVNRGRLRGIIVFVTILANGDYGITEDKLNINLKINDISLKDLYIPELVESRMQGEGLTRNDLKSFVSEYMKSADFTLIEQGLKKKALIFKEFKDNNIVLADNEERTMKMTKK